MWLARGFFTFIKEFGWLVVNDTGSWKFIFLMDEEISSRAPISKQVAHFISPFKDFTCIRLYALCKRYFIPMPFAFNHSSLRSSCFMFNLYWKNITKGKHSWLKWWIGICVCHRETHIDIRCTFSIFVLPNSSFEDIALFRRSNYQINFIYTRHSLKVNKSMHNQQRNYFM